VTTIQVRRGTAAQWTSANSVLAAGELGMETDTGNVKAGDGSTAWASLGYANRATYAQLTSMGRGLGTRWVPLGDSTTYGSDNVTSPARGASFPTFAGLASSERLHLIRNAGIVGNTTAQMLARFDTDVTPYTPTLVTILGGRNDISQSVSLATYQANIAAIVAKVRSINAVPVLGTITPASGSSRQTTNDWNNWLRAYAASTGIRIVDFFEVLADPATGSYLSAYNSGDNVHPSEAGYAAMGSRIASDLSGSLAPLAIPRLYDAGDTGNLFPNPLFLTTTLSSQAPSGLSLVNSGSVTGSFITSDTTIRGNWYRMTFASSASAVTLYKSAQVTATVGRVYAVTGRLKSALSAGTVTVQCGKGSGTAYAAFQLAEAIDGRFWVAFTAAGTLINPQIVVSSGATGTVDVAEWGVFDLTTLGIDTLVS
jgi:lysophospholipase L1-like esterase